MRRKRMAEGVTGDRLGQPGLADGSLDRFLQAIFIHMVAAGFAAARIAGRERCWEDVLPTPFPVGIRIFDVQGSWQIHPAVAPLQILFMKDFHPLQMRLENWHQTYRQHRHPIPWTFGVAQRDQMLCEIHVLDPEADALHEAHAGPIEEFGHQLMGAGHHRQDPVGFVAGHHDWQSFPLLRAGHVIELAEIHLQDFSVQKQ